MFRIYKYVDEELNKDPYSSDDYEDEEFTNFLDPNENEDEGDFDSDSEDFENMDNGEEQQEEDKDPDFQGIIRTVPGACLVYKRKDQQNNYEELWVYNVGGRDIRPETKVRNSILAGTDIDPKTQKSEDGQQNCETITVGNVQFLHITGLLN